MCANIVVLAPVIMSQPLKYFRSICQGEALQKAYDAIFCQWWHVSTFTPAVYLGTNSSYLYFLEYFYFM